MTDVVVVTNDDAGDDVEEVAEVVTDVVEEVADAVVDVAEAVADAVTEGTTTGHDPIELEHRLTNIEHELQELRSRSYEAATHQEVAQVVEEVVQTAAVVAAEVADDVADDNGDGDVDVTIVEPDVAETETKRKWWERVW